MRTACGTILALLVLAPALDAAEFKAGAVTVSAPWARATPGGATNGAVYLTLALDGGTGDRLTAAASPRAQRAELHTTRDEAGVMRMMPLAAIPLDPGAPPTVLASGGTHIMLLGLDKPLVEGEVLPLTLTFARAGALTLTVPVLAIAAKGPGDLKALDDPHAGH